MQDVCAFLNRTERGFSVSLQTAEDRNCYEHDLPNCDYCSQQWERQRDVNFTQLNLKQYPVRSRIRRTA